MFSTVNPTCIDLIVINKKSLFRNSNISEVGISDHHSIITTALITQVIKGKKEMQKWECIEIIKPLTLNSSKEKLERVVALLNKYAPIKQKIMGFNNNSFLSKAFRKAIIHRSKLKKYL